MTTKKKILLIDDDRDFLMATSAVRSMDMGEEMPLILLSGVDLQGPYQSFEPSDEFPKVNMILHKPVKADDLIRYVEDLSR
ncbi:MAG: hypothetical protein JRD43_06930 [Deltaproteobacteria bacterium]|nr:hypothetical protein [Deltaproteobacteria bacterium]